MMRRASNFAIGASFALAVGVVLLWVRSCRVIDLVVLESSPKTFRALGLREGAVYYLRTEVYGGISQDTSDMPDPFDMSSEGPPGYRAVAFRDTMLGRSMPREHEFFGFFHGMFDIAAGQVALEMSIPLWPLLAPAVGFLTLSLISRLRREGSRRAFEVITPNSPPGGVT
jgi:hypothetical protein